MSLTSIFSFSISCSSLWVAYKHMQVKVLEGGTDWGWGVVVNVMKKPSASSGSLPAALASARGNTYIVDTLLHCSLGGSKEAGSRPKPSPPRPGEKGEMHVVSWQNKNNVCDKILLCFVLSNCTSYVCKRDGCHKLRFPGLQVPVQLPLISSLSQLRISVPSDLRPMEARQNVLLSVQELGKRFPQGLPKLNPVKVCGHFLCSFEFFLLHPLFI